jgi:hypothetical protein
MYRCRIRNGGGIRLSPGRGTRHRKSNEGQHGFGGEGNGLSIVTGGWEARHITPVLGRRPVGKVLPESIVQRRNLRLDFG